MRILLVHPDDSPRRGPWSRQSWDLIVDLGRSSAFSEEEWAGQYGGRVLRSDLFRNGIEDLKYVRKMFSAGRGRLVDEEGIDWWDLTSLMLAPQVLELLALRRLAPEISRTAELWSTRPGGSAKVLALLLGRNLQSYGQSYAERIAGLAFHYAGLLRRFPPAQIKEIFLDKYDAQYKWRARFASPHIAIKERVVLVPSAYVNVSRMASAYARLLPQQPFLLVATRQSAKRFVAPEHMGVRDLAAYVKDDPSTKEVTSLHERWGRLRTDLCSSPEIQTLLAIGELSPVPGWIEDGLVARDAWRAVLDREPICGVLCGDDSNLYTRLPVALAARRNIPTVDFHHGAFDGRYLLKDLPCDMYLAKNEVERDYLVRLCGLPEGRIALGAPIAAAFHSGERKFGPGTSVVYFSEPYEVYGLRAEEVYREVLPPLSRLAREQGRDVMVKLHPSESLSQRRRLVADIVAAEDRSRVSVLDGPLTDQVLSRAWFGITVTSTTVMDCLQNGIPCFLCGWINFLPYGYLDQFQRFQIGEVLKSVKEVAGIPQRLQKVQDSAARAMLSKPVDPHMLQGFLTSGAKDRARSERVSIEQSR